MLIKNDFEVAQPIDKVWTFFDDIPAVAACLPGAELTEDLGDDKYRGKVLIRMGPVKLQFAGNVAITERDNAGKRIVVDAAGADEKGRGQAAMLVTAKLLSISGGTKIEVVQDLQLSGAAAQYGRGMVSDVTTVENHVGLQRGEVLEPLFVRRRVCVGDDDDAQRSVRSHRHQNRAHALTTILGVSPTLLGVASLETKRAVPPRRGGRCLKNRWKSGRPPGRAEVTSCPFPSSCPFRRLLRRPFSSSCRSAT